LGKVWGSERDFQGGRERKVDKKCKNIGIEEKQKLEREKERERVSQVSKRKGAQ
jgi:hypothetical protein